MAGLAVSSVSCMRFWQAFARGYDVENREAVPAYLRKDVYEAIRIRAARVEVGHASPTEVLGARPARNLHRFVCPRELPAMLLAPWTYLEAESRAGHARDRSSIYGGFHVYARRPMS